MKTTDHIPVMTIVGYVLFILVAGLAPVWAGIICSVKDWGIIAEFLLIFPFFGAGFILLRICMFIGKLTDWHEYD